jgi:hypothetical protein
MSICVGIKGYKTWQFGNLFSSGTFPTTATDAMAKGTWQGTARNLELRMDIILKRQMGQTQKPPMLLNLQNFRRMEWGTTCRGERDNVHSQQWNSA